MAKPIHVASIEGVEVRFFAFPRDRLGQPPWVVFEDLHRAMKRPASDLDRCTEALYLLPAGQSRARISADDGLHLIVSYTVAFGFTSGLVSKGHASLSLVHAFGQAVSDAIDALLKDLPTDESHARKHAWLSEDPLNGSEARH